MGYWKVKSYLWRVIELLELRKGERMLVWRTWVVVEERLCTLDRRFLVPMISRYP